MSTRLGEMAAGLALALLISLLALPAQAAKVDFTATVDRERVALDQTITLQVTLAFDQGDDLGEVQLPETPDFDVIRQGRSEHTSFSFGGGTTQFRKSRTYSLVLQPRREGKLVILPGKVELDGKRYLTGKIDIQVGPPAGVAQGTQRQPGMTAPGATPFGPLLGGGPQASESDLFIRASVDAEEAFVGQQVALSIWLFSRVEVSHVESLKMPRLDGFWAEELETPRQISSTTRTIDGIPYRAYLIQRRALFPLRAGEVAIDPVQIDVVTGRSIFGGGRRQHRASPGSVLNVKELPEGAPPPFRRGNVGQWSFSVAATPGEVALGSPVTIRISAVGTGNLKNIELPALPPIDGFKIFDPSRSEDVQIRDLRYGGSKTLEYVLVPERAGSFAVPALEFSYFDPERGAYERARTEAIPIVVHQGQGAAVAAAPGTAPPAEQAGESGLQPLRAAPLVVEAAAPIYERPWFVAALLAPALAVLGVAATPLLRNRLALPSRRRRRLRQSGLPRALRDLADRNDPAFFPSCERALLDQAAELLGRPVHGLQRSELAAALAEAGLATDAVAAFVEALELCEMARYVPGATGDDAIASARLAAEQAIAAIEALA